MAATDKAITDFTALTAAPAVGDLIEIVDISEPQDADKNKKITIDWLFEVLKSRAISLLGSATINGQTTGSKQAIYTVPAGKIMIVDHVVFRDPTATLAGLVDIDLGGNALCDDWLLQLSLNAFTATTDYGKAEQVDQAVGPPIVPVKKTEYAAAVIFGAYINTGSTGAASFDIDLFGYLVDA